MESRRCEPARLADPEIYATGSPHYLWQKQRREEPVAWHTVADDVGYWSVCSYADVCRVLRDSTTFSSARGTMLNLLGKHDPAGGRQLAASDPPTHTRLREPVQKALSGRLINERLPQIRTQIVSLLDKISDDATIDLAEFTREVPMIAAGTLLGLPADDFPTLTRLTHMAVAAEDPYAGGGLPPEQALQTAHRELFAYFANAVSRSSESTGIIRELATAEDGNGRRLPMSAVVANCYSLILGSIVTTPQVPNALIAELAGKNEYRAWAGDPNALTTGIEEAIRWASPTIHFMRHATQRTQLGGQTISEGDPVVVWLASANRDESEFADPYALDVRRRPNRHVAFGLGPHACVGQAVARATLGVLFQELFRAIADVRLAGEPIHLRSNFLAGITHLPVHVSRRSP